ncbi:MAG TPA: prepilin-type N-terminal cleavage/methylation domain-containing protein [Gemmatimonadaceae bacterium]|nr:prepilin-type N-terminal cleavage/methylation domain-containing protein [Gemmatimonadaceae bacterium]
MRAGFTITELLLCLAIAAILAGITLPAMLGMRDRLTVRLAAVDAARTLADARSVALTASRRTAVRIDARTNTLTVVSGNETIRTLRLDEYGVRLRTTRDSIAFGPTGIGWGAATATITLSRGRASTALAVSRIGRIRRT